MSSQNLKSDNKAHTYKNRLINNVKQDKLNNDLKNMHISEPKKFKEVESYKPECNGVSVKENGDCHSISSSSSTALSSGSSNDTHNKQTSEIQQQNHVKNKDNNLIMNGDNSVFHKQKKLPNHNFTNTKPSNPITQNKTVSVAKVSKDLLNIGHTSASTLGPRSNIKIQLKFLQDSQLNIENKRDSIEANELEEKVVKTAESPISNEGELNGVVSKDNKEVAVEADKQNEENDINNNKPENVLPENAESIEKETKENTIDNEDSTSNICVNPVCCNTTTSYSTVPSSNYYYTLPTTSTTNVAAYMNDGQFNNGSLNPQDPNGQFNQMMRMVVQQQEINNWALLQQQIMNNQNSALFYPPHQTNPQINNSKTAQHLAPSNFMQHTYTNTQQQPVNQHATYIPFIQNGAPGPMSAIPSCGPPFFYPTPTSYYPTNHYFPTPNSARANGPIQHTSTNPTGPPNNPVSGIPTQLAYFVCNPYVIAPPNQYNLGSSNPSNSSPMRLINNNNGSKSDYNHHHHNHNTSNNYNASSTSSNSNYQR